MSHARSARRRWTWLLLIFVLHVTPFVSRGSLIGGDEPHYALMAHSIAVDRDLDLRNNYEEVARGGASAGRKAAGKVLDRHVRIVNGREIPIHPVGLPLLAAPVVAVKEAIAPGSSPDVLLALMTLSVTFAALIMGWRLLSRLMADEVEAALVATCVYFGSPLWFYSRTFFTEPYQWSFAVFAVAAVARERFVAASLFLGLVLAMKETGLLLVIPIVVAAVAGYGLKRSSRLLLGPFLFGCFFLLKNLVIAGTPFSTFQAYAIGDPVAGTLGLLIAPSAGLLWFAPVLLLALIGVAGDAPVPRWLRIPAVLAFGAYFLVSAAWTDWRGGSGYASRLVVPALPALAVTLATLRMSDGRWRGWIFPAFLLGFIPNWCAALTPFAAFWNATAPSLVAGNPINAALGLLVGVWLYRLAGPGGSLLSPE